MENLDKEKFIQNIKEEDKGWMVQMKPFQPSDRNKNLVQEFQKESIKNEICGMGWNIKKHFNTNNEIELNSINREFFVNAYNNEHGGTTTPRSLSHALNSYENIKKGDYLLTRLFGSNECYIGKVIKKAFYNQHIYTFKNASNYSWVVNVDWKHIGHFSNLPGALRGIMSGRWNTIKRIPEIHLNLLKILYNDGKDKEKMLLTKTNFHLALDPLELEDLVSFFMSSKYPDYHLVPSSCKINEPEIEFKMVNKEKQITCQVKSNKEIDISKYLNLQDYYEKIFLFSGTNYLNKEACNNKIEIIKKDELFTFLKENFEDKGYFYYKLSKYYYFK